MSQYLESAIEAARLAGAIQREKLGKVGFREKGRADLVTEVDLASQEVICGVLQKAFPSHSFLGEEQGKGLLTERQCGTNAPERNPLTWIIDPLDGTTNFIHRVPLFGPSIALACGNEILCGVIYNPISDELFTAENGSGAYLNGSRISVGNPPDLEHSLASVSFPTQCQETSPDFLAFLVMLTETQAIRRIGSTALNLAFLADGRFDLVSCQTAHVWDVAAGVLIAREAGAFISGPDGAPFDLASPGVIAAANQNLWEEYFESFESLEDDETTEGDYGASEN